MTKCRYKMKIRNLLFMAMFFMSSFASLLGIDMGQDFSKAVLVAPGVPFEIVMSADSKRKDVSGIAFKPLGGEDLGVERIYGSATNSHCTRFPKLCALNYKPLLGKSLQDPAVKEYLASHPSVELVPSKNNRETIAFKIDNHSYPVEELFAMNIQNIIGRASVLLKEKSPGGYSYINDVAFTIPSYFNMAQRLAIKDAAELAGLNVVGLIDDGLAIAVNYATKTEFPVGKQYHIIYDMGAGSTTATLVSFENFEDQTPLRIAIEGYSFDESLGGQVFTNAIAELIQEKFLEKHPSISTDELKSNPKALAKIFQTSEKVKLVLSANTEAPVSIESIVDDIDFKTKVTREEFEEFISEYAPRFTKPILNSLESSGIKLEDIQSVIYSGGSQRVPFVQKHLLSLIGSDRVSKTVNADEAAVFGATLRAVQISKMFKSKDFNISENSIYDYTIKVNNGDDINVFPAGSNYDISQELDLTDAIIANDGLSLTLNENYRGFSLHESSDLEEMKSKFVFNETDCIGGVKYFGTFKLSESRIFQFETLEARCEIDAPENDKGSSKETESGFLNNILNGKDKKQPKKKVRKANIPLKTKFLSSRPLGTASKQDLRIHLQDLNIKDNQRKIISERLNELEATLYKARNYLEEDDLLENGPKSIIEETSSTIAEYLEWLDYESDGATSKDIKERLSKINGLVSQIKEFMESLSVSLESEDFEAIYQESVLAVKSLQEDLQHYVEESSRIAEGFEKLGLDYEKESKKLTKYARSLSKEKVELALKGTVNFFEEIKALFEGKSEIENHSREELFKLRKKALLELEKIAQLEKELKAVNAQRAKELNNVVARFIKQQQRAAAKEEARSQEEKEADTVVTEDEEPEVEEIVEEGAPETNEENEEFVDAEEGDYPHDEL